MNARALVGVLGITLCATGFVQGQPPVGEKQIQSIFDDWKARLSRCKSVRYTLKGSGGEKGTPPLPTGVTPVPTPKAPDVFPFDYVVVIDFIAKRYRIERTELVASTSRKTWLPATGVGIWNGKEIQTLAPRLPEDRRPNKPDAYITHGNLRHSYIEPELWPVFAAHGIVGTGMTPLKPDRLPVTYEADEFSLRGSVRHDGRNCLLVRTEPPSASITLVDELWVDSGRQSAVVRHTDFSGKSPRYRFDIGYQQTPHGWLPQRWTHTLSLNDKLMWSKTFTVQSIEADVPISDETFMLPLQPGMRVERNEFPQEGKGLNADRSAITIYQVDERGRLQTDGVPTGFVTEQGIQLPPERSSRWEWYLVGGIVACVLLGFGCTFWRRATRAKRLVGSSTSQETEVR